MEETTRPYPHLLTHQDQPMLLVSTAAAEADTLAQGYVLVPLETREVLVLPMFRGHQLTMTAI